MNLLVCVVRQNFSKMVPLARMMPRTSVLGVVLTTTIEVVRLGSSAVNFLVVTMGASAVHMVGVETPMLIREHGVHCMTMPVVDQTMVVEFASRVIVAPVVGAVPPMHTRVPGKDTLMLVVVVLTLIIGFVTA